MKGTSGKYIVNRVTGYSGHYQRSKPLLIRFFKNIDYLLRVRGLSRRDFKKEVFNFCGFQVSYAAISQYKREDSNFVTSQLCYLAVYADFFKVELIDLLSRDLEAEGYLQKTG